MSTRKPCAAAVLAFSLLAGCVTTRVGQVPHAPLMREHTNVSWLWGALPSPRVAVCESASEYVETRAWLAISLLTLGIVNVTTVRVHCP